MEDELKITMVTWADCESIEGWHRRLEIEEFINRPLSVFKSLGWLMHNGEDFVVLAMSVDSDVAGDLLKIPRKMIIDVQTLTGPGEDAPLVVPTDDGE